MIEITHANLVETLSKPGATILSEISAEQLNLLHMAVGISGEAGELLDAVKKAAVYQKPVDIENVIEELGDLEFYMQGLRSALRIGRDTTLLANIRKLEGRYHTGSYSNSQAQERADKDGAND